MTHICFRGIIFTMNLENIFPVCLSSLTPEKRHSLLEKITDTFPPASFVEMVEQLSKAEGLPPWLADLAGLEYVFYQVREAGCGAIGSVEMVTVNPTLQFVKLDWKNLWALLDQETGKAKLSPEQGEEFVLVFCIPRSKNICCMPATESDLLSLKLVVEGITAEEVAEKEDVAVGRIDQALNRAAIRGVLLKPPSAIRRNPDTFPKGENVGARFFTAPVFTLQWHITQVCDLHCKHCYDRSDRISMPLEKGLQLLDDMRSFCLSHNVRGQVSFSGGNPLLYPYFFELYQAAVDRNLMVAILGNPASRATMEKLIAIKRPSFFQVSLEGLSEHNDYIRGIGHFKRVLKFLALLKELKIYSMVMLTLTRDNMEQVLPLSEELRGQVDLFTFNRLAMVGEGASLKSVKTDEYADFLKKYHKAAKNNPVISLKDNLINIIRNQEGQPLFGGCAAYGCGAAFNFFSVLPDGEAHACRKLPSYIGNVFDDSIADVYHGDSAGKYRAGAAECAACKIRPVCGGCLAVVHGFGLDVFKDKDPYCFMQPS